MIRFLAMSENLKLFFASVIGFIAGLIFSYLVSIATVNEKNIGFFGVIFGGLLASGGAYYLKQLELAKQEQLKHLEIANQYRKEKREAFAKKGEEIMICLGEVKQSLLNLSNCTSEIVYSKQAQSVFPDDLKILYKNASMVFTEKVAVLEALQTLYLPEAESQMNSIEEPLKAFLQASTKSIVEAKDVIPVENLNLVNKAIDEVRVVCKQKFDKTNEKQIKELLSIQHDNVETSAI